MGTGKKRENYTGTGEGEAGSVTGTVTGTVAGTVTGIGGVGDLALSTCSTPPAVESAAAATALAAEGTAALPVKASGAEACGGDLVLSCDVFGYIGDLRPCFEAVRRLFPGETDGASRSGAAVFAFSAEAPPVGSAAVDAEAGGRGAGGRGGGAEGDAGGSFQAGEGRPGYELQGTGR